MVLVGDVAWGGYGELAAQCASLSSVSGRPGGGGVRVVTVPGAGHNVMFDNPDAFVRAAAGEA